MAFIQKVYKFKSLSFEDYLILKASILNLYVFSVKENCTILNVYYVDINYNFEALEIKIIQSGRRFTLKSLKSRILFL